MGQIKNIKLHIVTDIKVHNKNEGLSCFPLVIGICAFGGSNASGGDESWMDGHVVVGEEVRRAFDESEQNQGTNHTRYHTSEGEVEYRSHQTESQRGSEKSKSGYARVETENDETAW